MCARVRRIARRGDTARRRRKAISSTSWYRRHEPDAARILVALCRVSRAIDDVIVASHGLMAALKRGHVPFGSVTSDGSWEPTPLHDGVARYGNTLVYAIWAMLRAIEALRFAWTGKSGAPLQSQYVDDEPDEALGLLVEATAVADVSADQPRSGDA